MAELKKKLIVVGDRVLVRPETGEIIWKAQGRPLGGDANTPAGGPGFKTGARR